MTTDELFMLRCIELAAKGFGNVSPNPLVGAILVHDGKIIGEGFHQVFGGPHAEVNAIHSVAAKYKNLISRSTLYVNLEPCAHHGKTPPCVDLVLEHKIPRVVIANSDPFSKIAGKGIEKMKVAGIEVVTDVLKKQGEWLNRRFFTFHTKNRPYVILKWAQSKDGFFAKSSNEQTWISNELARKLVHRWRGEEQAIMVGRQTALTDNPQLTDRYWGGKQPLRVVVDQKLSLPTGIHLFDKFVPTLVLNALKDEQDGSIEYVKIGFEKDVPAQVLAVLFQRDIQSVMIEGGAVLINSFIKAGFWDEARVFTGNVYLGIGIPAPTIDGQPASEEAVGDNQLTIFINRS